MLESFAAGGHDRPRDGNLDEMAVIIGGKKFSLWRAADSEGEVLDLLVQRRRNTIAAIKLMRKLLKKLASHPRCW